MALHDNSLLKCVSRDWACRSSIRIKQVPALVPTSARGAGHCQAPFGSLFGLPYSVRGSGKGAPVRHAKGVAVLREARVVVPCGQPRRSQPSRATVQRTTTPRCATLRGKSSIRGRSSKPSVGRMCIPSCSKEEPRRLPSSPDPIFRKNRVATHCECTGQRACEEVAAVAQRDHRVGRVGREEPDVALRIVLCRALVSTCRVWVSALVAHRPYLHLLGTAPQQCAALRLAFTAGAGSHIASICGHTQVSTPRFLPCSRTVARHVPLITYAHLAPPQ